MPNEQDLLEISRLRNRAEQLKTEITRLRNQVEQRDGSLKRADAELHGVRESAGRMMQGAGLDLGEALAKVETIRTDLGAARATIAELTQQLDGAQRVNNNLSRAVESLRAELRTATAPPETDVARRMGETGFAAQQPVTTMTDSEVQVDLAQRIVRAEVTGKVTGGGTPKTRATIKPILPPVGARGILLMDHDSNYVATCSVALSVDKPPYRWKQTLLAGKDVHYLRTALTLHGPEFSFLVGKRLGDGTEPEYAITVVERSDHTNLRRETEAGEQAEH